MPTVAVADTVLGLKKMPYLEKDSPQERTMSGTGILPVLPGHRLEACATSETVEPFSWKSPSATTRS